MAAKLPLIGNPPKGITCTDWESAGEPGATRRCKYVTKQPGEELTESALAKAVRLPDGRYWTGMCSVVNRFICEEWVKIHPEDVLPPQPSPKESLAAPVVPVNLFGEYEPPAEPRAPRKGTGRALLAWEAPKAGPASPWPIGDAVVAGLVATQTEVHLEAPGLDLWVVPEHTEQERLEITFAEFALLRALTEAFPGSRLVSLTKADPTAPEGSGARRKVFELVITEEMIKKIKRLNPATGLDKEFEAKMWASEKEKLNGKQKAT